MVDALENVEKIRILVGLNVDRFTVKIIDRMKQEIAYAAISAKDGKEVVSTAMAFRPAHLFLWNAKTANLLLRRGNQKRMRKKEVLRIGLQP